MNAPDFIKAEELLEVLFQSPNATAVYANDTITILSANAAMLALWGRDKTVIGNSFKDALPELIDQPFYGILQQVWRSGETFIARDQPATLQVEGRLRLFYFDFEYKAILDEDGKTKYILHTAFEVSQRMRALKLAEEKSIAEQKLMEELTALNEEFQTANEDLHALNEEYLTSNENLAVLNEEFQVTNEELLSTQEQLQLLNQDLMKSEERFRSLIEQAPVAMASLQGREFNIEVVNKKVLEIWGKDSSVLGKTLEKALPELNGQQFIPILQEVFDTGIPFFGKELKATLNVGGELTDRYLDFVYQPVKSNDGNTDSILIVANDITYQVLARKAVDELNTRLEIALDASKLGSTEVAIATGVMQSTAQFKRNYGYEPDEEFTYADLFAAMFPEHHERVRGLVREAMATNGVYKTEYPIRWRDGSVHWIQAHGRPRYDENGKADRMVGMTLDITEAKLYEQRKDDFLSVASHELKTPITSLKASLQLLERIKDKPFSDMHIKLIEQSSKSVNKMNYLVGELLNIGRLTGEQLSLERTRFNLHDMMAMSCSHVRLEGKYELILKGDQELFVYADEHRIDQVVVNFVNNAIKYASESKEIHMQVGSVEGFAKVSVTDFGPGINEHILPNLFDRYYRVDQTEKVYNGLGLGLYICKKIIEKHGGKIGVESTVGEGSTFWFTLPL
ncbi:PAS domain-containing protein [Pedobacter sp. MC2016-15]|uniref:ATP-binding protein n=1 Tax=Pedobacter sp. MC2016-15 TaxID=2994473 RepID=UPI002245BE55|nr:ATP-binding protein [Pedobacter sp. MC2016-15]MCX2480652.1 PAS domain-containing protein [Pedobacter sp. MC2016-15]